MFAVVAIGIAEVRKHLLFFLLRQLGVDQQEDWKHYKGDQCRPLQEKAKHDQHEANVLWVADPRIGPVERELVSTLSLVEHTPGACQ